MTYCTKALAQAKVCGPYRRRFRSGGGATPNKAFGEFALRFDGDGELATDRRLPDDPVGFIQDCVPRGRLFWTHHVNMRLAGRFIPRDDLGRRGHLSAGRDVP